MTWPEFLGAIANDTQVSLVGPVLDAPPEDLKGPVIYVDGGARYRNAKIETSVAVGDGDSGPVPLDHRLPAAKDYSDLAFVLREIPPLVTRLRLFGFWGGRPDHHMINFGEIHAFMKGRRPGTRVEWQDGHATRALGASGELKISIHGTFSVVTLEATRISIRGACTYKLPEPTLILPLASYGLSNEGQGEVTIAGEGPYFIFLNGDEPASLRPPR